MTDQKMRKKLFACLTAGFACVAVVGVCLTSCRMSNTEGKNSLQDDSSSIKDDALNSKIVYYEAQIQNLTAQLDTVEQQLYIMREDYLDQLDQLEQRLNSTERETQGNDSDEIPMDDSANTSTQPLPSDPFDDNTDVQLCEYTYRLENNFAILTSYLGSDSDVVVPAAVDGHLVIGLADRTFANCNVRSVVLPDTIEKLGWFTFYECENLEKVVLPGRLSVIGYASFDGCAPSLCLYVKSGSYAEQFANSFGLRCEETT